MAGRRAKAFLEVDGEVDGDGDGKWTVGAGKFMIEKMPSQNDLVFAIAHEIGNYLGAIRLQAHLLDEDLDPRALATTSVEIDGLAGRAGPLLTLLRPVLSSTSQTGSSAAQRPRWSGLLRGLGQQLEDEGTRGVLVEITSLADTEIEAPGVDWLHALLLALVESTIASVPGRSRICLGLESRGSGTVLAVEDDGEAEDLSAEAPLRGRPLTVSIARRLLFDLGGRVEVARIDQKTRVELVFPEVDRSTSVG